MKICQVIIVLVSLLIHETVFRVERPEYENKHTVLCNFSASTVGAHNSAPGYLIGSNSSTYFEAE